MIGAIVETSLAIAPAVILVQRAEVTDLDGPLLLTRDREPGLAITGSLIHPPAPWRWR